MLDLTLAESLRLHQWPELYLLASSRDFGVTSVTREKDQKQMYLKVPLCTSEIENCKS